MLKKALFVDENRNQIEPRMGFLQFYVKTKKVCNCFASFSSEQAHFTHGMYITAREPTFVWLFRDIATTAKGPGCDEGTNLR